MNQRLDVPAELEHLIEKREQSDRRRSQDCETEDIAEQADNSTSLTGEEDRRRKPRRSNDRPS